MPSLGMSKRVSKRISFFELTNESWVREFTICNEVSSFQWKVKQMKAFDEQTPIFG